jgi:hypothetical protein
MYKIHKIGLFTCKVDYNNGQSWFYLVGENEDTTVIDGFAPVSKGEEAVIGWLTRKLNKL